MADPNQAMPGSLMAGGDVGQSSGRPIQGGSGAMSDEHDDGKASRWQIGSSALSVLEQVYLMDPFPGACNRPACPVADVLPRSKMLCTRPWRAMRSETQACDGADLTSLWSAPGLRSWHRDFPKATPALSPKASSFQLTTARSSLLTRRARDTPGPLTQIECVRSASAGLVSEQAAAGA